MVKMGGAARAIFDDETRGESSPPTQAAEAKYSELAQKEKLKQETRFFWQQH
jgi:hypothetical protein